MLNYLTLHIKDKEIAQKVRNRFRDFFISIIPPAAVMCTVSVLFHVINW